LKDFQIKQQFDSFHSMGSFATNCIY